MNIIETSFQSLGDRCSGTLYLPENIKNPPVIILGHGFAALKSFGLKAFAQRFVEQGFAAYCFDYRSFGESEGQPRHWVDPARHIEDWHAAIAHIREYEAIDPTKIVLWGSSFGGGHVLSVAAQDSAIAGLIAQVPHVDGIATALCIKPADLIKASYYACKDLLGQWLFKRPHYSPVLGRTGEFAAMSSDASWQGYRAIVPQDCTWENKCLSRVFLKLPLYSPIRSAKKIRVPSLIIAGKDDPITPAAAAEKTASRIEGCKFSLLDCDHFSPYLGAKFEENIGIQIDFLNDLFPHNAKA